jgi:hypothetical protein
MSAVGEALTDDDGLYSQMQEGEGCGGALWGAI